MLRLAVKHRFLIVEDDPCGDLRFLGSAVPSILALSNEVGLEKRRIVPVPPAPSVGTQPVNVEYAAWLQARKAAGNESKRELEEP